MYRNYDILLPVPGFFCIDCTFHPLLHRMDLVICNCRWGYIGRVHAVGKISAWHVTFDMYKLFSWFDVKSWSNSRLPSWVPNSSSNSRCVPFHFLERSADYLHLHRFLVLSICLLVSYLLSGYLINGISQEVLAAQDLLDYSMSIQDPRWDETYKVVWFNDDGPWSIRFTAWYTAGLLHRNQGNDVENAKAALQAM